MVNEGHIKRGLLLPRIAELCAMNPAKAHGLYPRKGSLMVGADADLAVVDLKQEREVTTAGLHSAQDYTPFEGLRLRGWTRFTLLRGQLTFAEGQVMGRVGMGNYLKRPL
jgi:dihydroorotase-like cyclic amidohydrolase